MSDTMTLPAAQALFDEMADAVYLLDPATSRVLWVNRAAWAMLGLSAVEVLDHSVLSLQMDVTGMPQWDDIAAVIRGQSPYVFVGRHRHRDGREVPVEVVTSRFVIAGREYFLSVARDVTNRLAIEHQLHEREHQLWFALNEAADGLWDWDIADHSVFFSPQLKRMLGYGPEEMTPTLETWTSNLHPDDMPVVQRLLQEHLDGRRGRFEAEYRLRNRNGHYLWVHDHGRVSDRDGQGRPTRMVGMVKDITDRKLAQLALEERAVHDGLTGLPNRRHGDEFLAAQLSACQRQGRPLGLCMIDLDHFKEINDLHGHHRGDTVLRAVAGAIAGRLRRSDLACRWGGEEFMIICPDTGLGPLQQVAQRVREGLAAQLWQEQLGVSPVTASIGLAVFPDHGQDLLSLVTTADLALYRAKSSGRDRCEIAQA